MATEPFIGEIKIFGFDFPPRGYMACSGQLLSIASNTALFSILGTTYGGDGVSTFALPDLRNRVAAGVSSTMPEGALLGSATTIAFGQGILSVANIPAHTHAATGTMNVNNAAGTSTDPTNNYLGSSGPATDKEYNEAAPTGTMNAGAISVTVGSTGNGVPFTVQTSVDVMQPTLALNYIICTEGIYPPHP
ncbi:MAG: phage tail protein [Flavobacterium sp.]|nr:phage tail protein [Flavobacterium sp.]